MGELAPREGLFQTRSIEGWLLLAVGRLQFAPLATERGSDGVFVSLHFSLQEKCRGPVCTELPGGKMLILTELQDTGPRGARRRRESRPGPSLL